jgi:hypothetical protein
LKTCTLSGCYEPYYCSGLCKKHYARQARLGTTQTDFQLRHQDKIGQKYNHLKIIGVAEKTNAVCLCYCGNIKSIPLCDVIGGYIVSCGCEHYRGKRKNVLQRIDKSKLINVSEKCKKYYEDYITGLSYTEIGKKYGISRQRVGQIFKKIFKEGLANEACSMI